MDESDIVFDFSHHLGFEDQIFVESILRNSFSFTTIPEADRHLLVRHRNHPIGYCALTSRRFKLGQNEEELFLLGFFTIELAYRLQGIGTALLQYCLELSRSLRVSGVILNCGIDVVVFYESVGFRKISDRASYTRDGKLMIDDDPVLFYSFERRFEDFRNTECVHFGTDF